MNFKKFLFSFICLFCFLGKAFAAEPMLESIQQSMRELQISMQQLQSTVQAQNEIIRQQSVKIEALEQNSPVSIPGQNAASSTAASSPGQPQMKGLSGWNPEIGVSGTVQTYLTEDTADEEGKDTIALKELELNFAQVVDPYSRMDAIIAFNDNLEAQNVDIEEAYYTRWGLPLGFTTQLGKFRSKIGKVNLQHLHQLSTADYPLVIQDFFGDEGLAASGARLQNYIPNPWDIPLEITGEVLRGNNGASFSGKSRRPIFNTHLKTSFDMTDDSNAEFGFTSLFGDENPPLTIISEEDGSESTVTREGGNDRYGVKVFGADATFNWLLPEGKELKWQNEIYFQNRGNLVHANDNPWGFYTLLEHRFSKRFSVGTRFDYLEPLDIQGQHGQTIGVSPYLIFWQSEFADLKLQYSHTEPAGADARSDNAVYITVDFLIGAHKHPVQ